MSNLEKRIQEQRTIEALRKDFMGLNGKIGMICCVLGDPIISHEVIDDQVYYGIPDMNESEEEMPTTEEDTITDLYGYNFDGLSRGFHVEIVVKKGESEITLYYKGYSVYNEKNGKLLAYAPFPEWETIVEKLYKQAREKAKNKKINFGFKETQENEINKQAFLRKLRMRWGI